MDWTTIAKWAKGKACKECRCWGQCNHRGGCADALKTAQECESLANGQGDAESVLAFAQRHLCFNHEICNHPGCSKTQDIIDWVSQLYVTSE